VRRRAAWSRAFRNGDVGIGPEAEAVTASTGTLVVGDSPLSLRRLDALGDRPSGARIRGSEVGTAAHGVVPGDVSPAHQRQPTAVMEVRGAACRRLRERCRSATTTAFPSTVTMDRCLVVERDLADAVMTSGDTRRSVKITIETIAGTSGDASLHPSAVSSMSMSLMPMKRCDHTTAAVDERFRLSSWRAVGTNFTPRSATDQHTMIRALKITAERTLKRGLQVHHVGR